jgi:hypothetical protein
MMVSMCYPIRFTAVKFKDLVASAEMLDSPIGCKMQYLYRLTIQQPMVTPGNSEDITDKETTTKSTHVNIFVRLGPSTSPRPRAWFGPKRNTKLGLHTTLPPQTVRPVPRYIGS